MTTTSLSPVGFASVFPAMIEPLSNPKQSPVYGPQYLKKKQCADLDQCPVAQQLLVTLATLSSQQQQSALPPARTLRRLPRCFQEKQPLRGRLAGEGEEIPGTVPSARQGVLESRCWQASHHHSTPNCPHWPNNPTSIALAS